MWVRGGFLVIVTEGGETSSRFLLLRGFLEEVSSVLTELGGVRIGEGILTCQFGQLTPGDWRSPSIFMGIWIGHLDQGITGAIPGKTESRNFRKWPPKWSCPFKGHF